MLPQIINYLPVPSKWILIPLNQLMVLAAREYNELILSLVLNMYVLNVRLIVITAHTRYHVRAYSTFSCDDRKRERENL